MSAYSLFYHWMHIRPGTPQWVVFAVMGAFALILLYCAWVDLDKMIIPNKITLPLIAFFMLSAPLLWQNWVSHLVTGFLVGAFFFLVASIPIRGQYGMGMGDVKMYTAIGFAFGLGSLLCILIATLAGSIVGIFVMAKHGRGKHIPHAPHIALAVWITIALGIQGVLA